MRWAERRQRLANASDFQWAVTASIITTVVALRHYNWWQSLLQGVFTYLVLRSLLFLAQRLLRGEPRPKPASPAPERFVPGDFSVYLQAAGQTKIALIKEVRSVNGLGLKEAKLIVDSAPSYIRGHIDEAAALAIKARLENAGGTATIE